MPTEPKPRQVSRCPEEGCRIQGGGCSKYRNTSLRCASERFFFKLKGPVKAKTCRNGYRYQRDGKRSGLTGNFLADGRTPLVHFNHKQTAVRGVHQCHIRAAPPPAACTMTARSAFGWPAKQLSKVSRRIPRQTVGSKNECNR